MSELKYPDNLRYTKEHEWVKLDGDNAIVGITDFAQHQLTDVVFVELPQLGKPVKATSNLCAIESVKSVSDVYSPVSGEVIEVNSVLSDKPELVNEDCYGKAWIAKLKIKDKSEIGKLMTAAEYKKFISESSH